MSQIAPLSADQILAQFEELIQDSLDVTTELFLLNEVKDTIESERAWAKLTRLNKSNTAQPGNSFQTLINLPDDFIMPSPRGIYVGTDMIPYKQIPFEAQIDFQAVTYAYYIDYYGSQYALCGTVSQTGTIFFFYRASSPVMALTANGGQPWIFPAKFHPRLVYEMAIKYFAIDQGDKGRSWAPEWAQYAQRIQESMNDWDDQLQMNALQNELNVFVDPSTFPTIIDMDGGMAGGAVFG